MFSLPPRHSRRYRVGNFPNRPHEGGRHDPALGRSRVAHPPPHRTGRVVAILAALAVAASALIAPLSASAEPLWTLLSPTPGGSINALASVELTFTTTPSASATAVLSGPLSYVHSGPLSDVDGTNQTITRPLNGPGQITFVITATDLSAHTAIVLQAVFTVDVTAPPTPTVTSPSDGALLNTTTPTIEGEGEAGSTVSITGTTVPTSGLVAAGLAGITPVAAATGSGTVDEDGTWSITLTDLSQGIHSLSITATDAASNVSGTATLTFTVDSIAPDAPEILTPTGEDTKDPQPDITGTAEPGSTVVVAVDGATIATLTAGLDGAWETETPDPLAPGDHTVTATATDLAQNTSATATREFAVVATVGPSRLPATGMSATGAPLFVAFAVLLLGAGVALRRRAA